MNRTQLTAAIRVLSQAIEAWELYALHTEDLFLYDFATGYVARMTRELAALRKELECLSSSTS